MLARGVNMTVLNSSHHEQTITVLDEAFTLPIPAIPEILHGTGDVLILTSLLTHCVLARDIYFQSIIRMPAWVFLALICSNNLRLRDERCAVLQELFRLGIIVYYGFRLSLYKFPSFMSTKRGSISTSKDSVASLAKREKILSEEEVQRFYKGVPTLIKLNEPPPYHTFPYDKTLELSHTHFTANKSQYCITGHNGISFQGMLNYNNKKVRACIKTNIAGDLKSLVGLMKEVKLLKFVGQHDNLQTLFGANTKDISHGKLFLVLENCSNRTLGMQLRNLQETEGTIITEESLNEDTLVDLYRWAYEISSGMKFISSKKIIHGSLTCECILLNEVGTVKLTDYGTAPYLSDASAFQPELWDHDGWKYLAPEAIIKTNFTTAGDIWSFGIVLWKIFTIFSDPYPAFDTYSKIFPLGLLDGMRPEAHHKIPPYIEELLSKCWLQESERRPTFDMCCQYTYAKTKPKRRIVTCDDEDFIT